jgi:phosphoesterase RecJ-like protein
VTGATPVLLAEAAESLRKAGKILLTAHRGPDGDSIGSLVALAALLREHGKEATLYNPDLVPRNLKWLPHARSFVRRLKKQSRYDVTVIVDCGDRQLLGDDFPAAQVTGPLIVLDHHTTVRPFGDMFIGDPAAACVGVLVTRLAGHLGWDLSAAAAQGVFVSLVADTGSFRYANANAEAFRLAADLVERGLVDAWSIQERMHERVPLSRYRLLAAALAGLELALDGKVAFIVLTQETLEQAKASWEDSAGIVNYARTIDGVECGVLITPAKQGGIRVSMRSKGRLVDAGAVCGLLGGGGHPGAAGCRLDTDIGSAKKQVEDALRAVLVR